jgi:hypothetical protein
MCSLLVSQLPDVRHALVYRHSQGDTHLYRCPKHGVVVLPPSGIVHIDDPDESAVRH